MGGCLHVDGAARALQPRRHRRASDRALREARPLVATRTSGPARYLQRSTGPGSSRPAPLPAGLQKCGHVARRDQQGCVADHLGDRPGSGGDHGHPERHCFQWRQTEALVERGIGEYQCTRDEGAPVVDPPDAMDTCGVPSGPETRRHGVFAPSGRAGDLEVDIGNGRGDAVEGRHQIGEALAWFHGSDGQDVGGFGFVPWERVKEAGSARCGSRAPDRRRPGNDP